MDSLRRERRTAAIHCRIEDHRGRTALRFVAGGVTARGLASRRARLSVRKRFTCNCPAGARRHPPAAGLEGRSRGGCVRGHPVSSRGFLMRKPAAPCGLCAESSWKPGKQPRRSNHRRRLGASRADGGTAEATAGLRLREAVVADALCHARARGRWCPRSGNQRSAAPAPAPAQGGAARAPSDGCRAAKGQIPWSIPGEPIPNRCRARTIMRIPGQPNDWPSWPGIGRKRNTRASAAFMSSGLDH